MRFSLTRVGVIKRNLHSTLPRLCELFSLSSIIPKDSDFRDLRNGDPSPSDNNASYQNFELVVKRSSDILLDLINHEMNNMLHVYAMPGFVEHLKKVNIFFKYENYWT